MQLSVTVDARAAVAYLDDVGRKQLPFAFARALTKTAQAVQYGMVGSLPGKFTLRNNWWKPSSAVGFRVEPAKKHDGSRMRATIYSKLPSMGIQESGGIKTPRGRMLAVPMSSVRRSKKDRILASNKPAALLHKGLRGKKAFIATARSGKVGIWMRKGKARLPIRLMYSLVPRTSIPARLRMQKDGTTFALRAWKAMFDESLQIALRSAR